MSVRVKPAGSYRKDVPICNMVRWLLEIQDGEAVIGNTTWQDGFWKYEMVRLLLEIQHGKMVVGNMKW